MFFSVSPDLAAAKTEMSVALCNFVLRDVVSAMSTAAPIATIITGKDRARNTPMLPDESSLKPKVLNFPNITPFLCFSKCGLVKNATKNTSKSFKNLFTSFFL